MGRPGWSGRDGVAGRLGFFGDRVPSLFAPGQRLLSAAAARAPQAPGERLAPGVIGDCTPPPMPCLRRPRRHLPAASAFPVHSVGLVAAPFSECPSWGPGRGRCPGDGALVPRAAPGRVRPRDPSVRFVRGRRCGHCGQLFPGESRRVREDCWEEFSHLCLWQDCPGET